MTNFDLRLRREFSGLFVVNNRMAGVQAEINTVA